MDDKNDLHAEVIPQSLKDIVNKNCELLEIRLAHENEIFKLHRKIEYIDQPKERLSNWNLVILDFKQLNPVAIILADKTRNGNPIRTSPIRGLDLGRGMAITRNNSIYQLDKKAHGEPCLFQLILLCNFLYDGGLGEMFGVPLLNY